jgi:PDZ domain-containing protein
VDTLDDMVTPPEPPAGGEPPPPPTTPPSTPVKKRRRWRGWRLVGVIATTVVVVLIVQVVVASQVKTPWIAFEPGSATPTDGLLTVDGAPRYDDNGNILYLTVRTNRLTALEWVFDARDPYVDIVREKDLYPDLNQDQVRQQNLQLMKRSKSDAELVALEYLGYDVFSSAGVDVVSVESGSAADGVLKQGDVITAVNGTTVNEAQSLVDMLRGMQPGATVTLAVTDADGSNPRSVQVTLGARPDGTGGGFLGISTQTHVIESPDIPVDLSIDTENVGGNSAGLAFTLTIIDALTPGSLTGDHKVAVTGTINLDGTVGDVGGVAQKSVAARRSGADTMIVPADLVNDAKKNAGDMQVIGVSTLKEALDALTNLGGNASELALPGASHTN